MNVQGLLHASEGPRPRLPRIAWRRVPWRRIVERAILALLLVVVPVANGVWTYGWRVWSWDYYAGDAGTRAEAFAFRNETLALAERVAYLQAGTDGDAPRYRWGPRPDGNAAGFGQTGRGYLPIAGREHVSWGGRKVEMGLVENATGAIVMALTGDLGSECHGLATWLSAYTMVRGTAVLVAPLDNAADMKAAVAAADWKPLADVLAACREDRTSARTLLMRFDGPSRD